MDRYEDRGLQAVTVLTRCFDGAAVPDRALTFAQFNGLDHPVLADADATVLQQGLGTPGQFVVIGADMVVRQVGPLAVNDRVVEGWLEKWGP